ncbi:MAG: hypothetical protein HY321_18990 [Armatimonadetes bacterium]|nr:hypothetical protein [Armatimonadota bacterium]
MEAVRLEAVVEKDGELFLRGLPCRRDQKVEVIILMDACGPPTFEEEGGRPPIWRRLAGVGAGLDLPEDLAEQHDYYAHGAPKR